MNVIYNWKLNELKKDIKTLEDAWDKIKNY